MKKIEQYIPNPLQSFKCQKFDHHWSVCNRHAICGKCGERDREPNHTISPSTAISRTDVPTVVKTIHPILDHAQPGKKEKEILLIKHTRNIPYPEARKIVEGYLKKLNLFPNLPKQPKNRVKKKTTTKN